MLQVSNACHSSKDTIPDNRILVLLQAMKADPPLDSRCRDKFLVQSAAITADKDFANIATVVCFVLYWLPKFIS